MTGAEPTLPIVAIGASAGGLNALRAFLGAVKLDTGAAYLIVQHLDPTHESQLVPLLAKITELPVFEARNGAKLERDTIFVAPPGKYLEVAGARLRLTEPPPERFTRTPIDHLFGNLSESGASPAIAVLLSGTGSDGTQGAREIKSAGGYVLVQDPAQAEFDGMPQSAIASGAADLVAPVEELPRRIVRILDMPRAGDSLHDSDEEAFSAILELLHEQCGYDFRNYKPGTLRRRIGRRIGICGASGISDYLDILQRQEDERGLLVKDLMIGVTRFFRDAEAWERFGRIAVDKVLQEMSDGSTLRAWAAGCATGEEAYTLAIIVLERIAASGKRIQPLIFATDLNEDSIESARAGRYPASAVADMPPELIDRWFLRKDDEVRVRPELRERLVFAVQNAVTDPPFSSLDLISCRNLLIYLDNDAQRQLFDTFHFSLRPDGYLMIGLSESVNVAKSLFESIDSGNRILRRRNIERDGGAQVPLRRREGRTGTAHHRRPETGGADTVVRAMLARFAPPAVLVDQNFDVQRFHGDLAPFIAFDSASMSGSLLSMLAEPLQARVWTSLRTAKRENRATDTVVMIGDECESRIKVIVEPVRDARSGQGYIVYFCRLAESPPVGPSTALPDTAEGGDVVAEYQAEIESLRHELQSVIERSETSNEELQAANEEVMSTNEELQSSNEELETSREELQSLNEELSTINRELEEKVAELEATTDDLANLVASTDIATLFLDTSLCIRRFAARARDIVAIRESDVGRPLEDLSFRIEDGDVIDRARQVLENLESAETEVTGDGYAYLRRITPYRTRQDRIEGVIITYSDIQRIRLASEKLGRQARRQSSIAELGELALSSDSVEDLFARATRDIAEHIDAKLVEIQKFEPERSSFLLVAGEGWPRGWVGHTRTPAEPKYHLGYSFRRLGVTEVASMKDETRFAPSESLADLKAKCGICITIGPMQYQWGVLGAWRDHDCNFTPEEANFLQAVAKILWLAVTQLESRRLRERERGLLQNLIDGLPMMVAVVDRNLHFEISNRAFERVGFTPDEVRNADFSNVFGAETAKTIERAIAHSPSEVAKAEVRIHVPGEGERTFLVHCAPRSFEGQVSGHYIAAIDIEERKQWEERNRIISAELDHRVKNILALVNTIARMTGRNTTSVEEFRSVFANRIHSLSRTHAALAQSQWTGMELQRIFRDELEVFAAENNVQYAIEGPDVSLGTRAAQSLSLVIHELATNAAKYGALSRPDGKLQVRWTIQDDGLRIDWREDGLQDLPDPEREGFGSTVIRTAIENQLRGDLDMEFRPTGLECSFLLPKTVLSDSPARSV